jgi:integrase
MSESTSEAARFAGIEPSPAESETSESGALEEVRERIAAVDQAASEYVAARRPGNTTRAYAADWAAWRRYCQAIELPAETFSPGLLAGFALWLEQGGHNEQGRPAAPSTIRRRIYGVVAALRECGVAVPAGGSKQANEAVKIYERRLAEAGERCGTGPAPAIAVTQLREMVAELPNTLAGTRDRAILLLGFALAARRDELAHLTVGDIRDDPNGLLVTVRYSKTGQRTVAVPRGKRAATCPARAWQHWAVAAGLTAGRAFRAIDRHHNIAASITGGAIGTLITQAADRAGLMVHFTAHSLRAGLATEARRAGHDPLSISRQGGWADGSTVLFGYMRIVDRWDDNALDGIGL